MTFKESLEFLVKKCEEIGVQKVADTIEEAYCDGAQGSYLIKASAERLK